MIPLPVSNLPKFKRFCCACHFDFSENNPESREHFWPSWLRQKYLTFSIFNSISGISPDHLDKQTHTFPLCSSCNTKMGSLLEQKMKSIIVEQDHHLFTHKQMEIFSRWLLKYHYYTKALRNKHTEPFISKLLSVYKHPEKRFLLLFAAPCDSTKKKNPNRPNLLLPKKKSSSDAIGFVLGGLCVISLSFSDLIKIPATSLTNILVYDLDATEGEQRVPVFKNQAQAHVLKKARQLFGFIENS